MLSFGLVNLSRSLFSVLVTEAECSRHSNNVQGQTRTHTSSHTCTHTHIYTHTHTSADGKGYRIRVGKPWLDLKWPPATDPLLLPSQWPGVRQLLRQPAEGGRPEQRPDLRSRIQVADRVSERHAARHSLKVCALRPNTVSKCVRYDPTQSQSVCVTTQHSLKVCALRPNTVSKCVRYDPTQSSKCVRLRPNTVSKCVR